VWRKSHAEFRYLTWRKSHNIRTFKGGTNFLCIYVRGTFSQAGDANSKYRKGHEWPFPENSFYNLAVSTQSPERVFQRISNLRNVAPVRRSTGPSNIDVVTCYLNKFAVHGNGRERENFRLLKIQIITEVTNKSG